MALHARLERSPAMIAYDTWNKYRSKLISKLSKSGSDKISKLIDTLVGSAVIRDLQFLVDEAADHVAAEANNYAGKLDRTAGFLEREAFDQADGAVGKTLNALGR